MESQWLPATERLVRQVHRIVDPPRQQHPNEDALLISVLAAFPDRVARRREAAELQLAAGDGGPAHSALRIPNSAWATVSFPQFSLGLTNGALWCLNLRNMLALKKRQRAAAVQNLAEIPSGPANAKRLDCASPLALWNAARPNPNSAGATGRVARL